MSEDSIIGISLRGFSVRVCCLNQGCCGSRQYNLSDKMLRLDANKILNQSYVVFVTLIYMIYQSYQHLPSTYSWDCGLHVVGVICPTVFLFQSSFLFLFPCSACLSLFVIRTLVIIIIISFFFSVSYMCWFAIISYLHCSYVYP